MQVTRRGETSLKIPVGLDNEYPHLSSRPIFHPGRFTVGSRSTPNKFSFARLYSHSSPVGHYANYTPSPGNVRQLDQGVSGPVE